ncbi:tyrosine-type recombinase/integrase [bacterium]|nr:tyrosine-type recombinase/integrase [bacterium]
MPPQNIGITVKSGITTGSENTVDDKSTTNLPSVLAGMERHEALAFVSKLYDHARDGHSVWGDKLLLRKFLGQCSRTNSAETRNGYMREMRHLCQWRDSNYPDLLLRQLDPYVMQQWVDEVRHCVDVGDIKPRTYNRRLSAVSAFYRWASEPTRCTTTGVPRNPVPSRSLLTAPKTTKSVSEEDLAGLLSAIARSSIGSPKAQRDYVLVKGSYLLGCRVSEISRLKWDDVERLNNGGQVHLLGKGSKSRVVRVSCDTVTLFESLGRGAPIDFIFKGQRPGTHLTRQAIAFAMRKWGRLTDLELHPHKLRHSHATHAVRRGVDVFTLQNTLGHRSSATTGHYVAENPDESSSLRLG